MGSQVAECGLCQGTRELRDSHLLPSAAYKLSRDASRRNPNPVVITREGALTTSHQVTAYFLCGECEDRFSRDGERYVLSQCARPRGNFKVRHLLEGTTPLVTDPNFRLYEIGSLLGPHVEHYLYFGTSVFWRAAARSWEFDGRPLQHFSLGASYQEQLRLYLLGRGPFPERGRLFVHVWSDERIAYTTVPPSTYRVQGTRRHKFCIPGLSFILFLGGEVSARYDMGALNSRQGHFMWLCRWQNDSLFRGFVQSISSSLSKRNPEGRASRLTRRFQPTSTEKRAGG
jgi:hypothetical protein